MCLEPLHRRLVGRRPTAIGVATQDIGKWRYATGERFAIGQRPTMESLSHNLDLASHPEILDPQLAQRDVEMAKHGVEKGLRQPFALWLLTKTFDSNCGMQRQRVKSTIERIGNAAGIEQCWLTRLFGRPEIERGGKFIVGAFAA